MTMSIFHHKPNQKKVGFKLSLLLLPVLFSFLFSCRYQVPESSLKAVSQKTKDSVDYLPEHYYTLNSNFEVTSDSLLLQQLPLIRKELAIAFSSFLAEYELIPKVFTIFVYL